MNILGAKRFDQYVLNMAVINICNQTSDVGEQMRKFYQAWKDETNEAIRNPWQDLHWFTIYVPHPDQEYEEITLEEGLTKGYNIEVKPVEDKTKVPYNIPEGGHFVVILKQKALNSDFAIAATGIFVRPLALLVLDVIIDLENGESQRIVVKHPIIRDYPQDWEEKLKLFLNKEIRWENLPNLVRYVDQSFNQDYRPPSWDEIRTAQVEL